MSTELLKQERPAEIVVREEVNPMSILQLAIEKGASIDQLERLMAMQERFEANAAKKAFNAAMAKFKENPPKISKNKHVKFGQTEYDHATLDHVAEQITEALSKVGISHKWAVDQHEQIAVTCILTHQIGHSESTTLRAAPDSSGSKNGIQAIGSTVTYLQRYTLLAATGLAAGLDDDGKAADRLPDEEFLGSMEAIENADTLQSLQKAFTVAYKQAQAAKDTKAMSEFIAAKDKRKAELNEGR